MIFKTTDSGKKQEGDKQLIQFNKGPDFGTANEYMIGIMKLIKIKMEESTKVEIYDELINEWYQKIKKDQK